MRVRIGMLLVIGLWVQACGGSSDGGAVTQVDSGNGDDAQEAAIVDPFAGAPAFSGGSATTASVVSKHKFEVNVDPTGRDCFGSNCHGHNAKAPSLLFGGTVYKDSDATGPAVGVEIRVLDANGTARSTYSDTNGNFYVRGTGTLALPGHSGARNATGSLIMEADVTDRSCNTAQCHDGTTNSHIYAP
jgi:hypothetical protein